MLVLAKRIIRYNQNFNPSKLDKKFVKVGISRLPRPGENLHMQLGDLNKTTWISTQITGVEFKKSGVLVYTLNSKYHLKGI